MGSYNGVKEQLGLVWLTVEYFVIGWPQFFKEEYFVIFILHVAVWLLSFIINIFYIFSQWQVSIIIILFRRILCGAFCTSKKRLDGKLVLITGANTGLGKLTAKDLCSRGAKVVIACRNIDKGYIAAREIQEETGQLLEVRKLDLSSLDSVRSFVRDFKEKYSTLDMLINNAGIMFVPFGLTVDGHESQFGVNHLGHFLLTNLLLPELKAASEARIINVSSQAHNFASENFLDDISSKYEKKYDRAIAYGNSKVCNVLFTLQLNEILKGTNVKTYALHPGLVQTELGRHIPFGGDFVYSNLICLFAKNTFEGIQTTVYCATEAAKHPYCYFSDCAVGNPSILARDEEKAKKLWNFSKKLTGLED